MEGHLGLPNRGKSLQIQAITNGVPLNGDIHPEIFMR